MIWFNLDFHALYSPWVSGGDFLFDNEKNHTEFPQSYMDNEMKSKL